MQIAVDISLYPLTDDFIPPIDDIIRRLNAYPGLDVVTNAMSTQLRGEYDVVMGAINNEVKATFVNVPRAVFAIKVLHNPPAS